MSPRSERTLKRHYARKISRLPRWSHRVWAFALGYFWLACHLCGTYSGGHEWRDIDGKSSSVNVVGFEEIDGVFHGVTKRRGICPACTREGLGSPTVAMNTSMGTVVFRQP